MSVVAKRQRRVQKYLNDISLTNLLQSKIYQTFTMVDRIRLAQVFTNAVIHSQKRRPVHAHLTPNSLRIKLNADQLQAVASWPAHSISGTSGPLPEFIRTNRQSIQSVAAYAAPELLSDQKNAELNAKIDVYSLGRILLDVMLCPKTSTTKRFNTALKKAQGENDRRKRYIAACNTHNSCSSDLNASNCPDSTKRTLKTMLAPTQSERPEMTELTDLLAACERELLQADFDKIKQAIEKINKRLDNYQTSSRTKQTAQKRLSHSLMALQLDIARHSNTKLDRACYDRIYSAFSKLMLGRENSLSALTGNRNYAKKFLNGLTRPLAVLVGAVAKMLPKFVTENGSYFLKHGLFSCNGAQVVYEAKKTALALQQETLCDKSTLPGFSKVIASAS